MHDPVARKLISLFDSYIKREEKIDRLLNGIFIVVFLATIGLLKKSPFKFSLCLIEANLLFVGVWINRLYTTKKIFASLLEVTHPPLFSSRDLLLNEESKKPMRNWFMPATIMYLLYGLLATYQTIDTQTIAMLALSLMLLATMWILISSTMRHIKTAADNVSQMKLDEGRQDELA